MDKLFLHGFASNRYVWQEFFDLPDSFFPDIEFDGENMPILPEISRKTILIGWSMGGMIALELLKKYPDLIKGIVLISSSPGYVSSDLFPKGKDIESVNLLRKAIEEGDMKVLANFQRQLFTKSEIREGWLRKFRKEVGPHLASISTEELVSQLKFLESYRPEDLDSEAEIIAFHGDGDIVVDPSALNSWEKIFPDAETILVEGGHAIPFRFPELVKEKILEMESA